MFCSVKKNVHTLTTLSQNKKKKNHICIKKKYTPITKHLLFKATFVQEQDRFKTTLSLPSFLASLGDRKTIYGYSEIITTQIGCTLEKLQVVTMHCIYKKKNKKRKERRASSYTCTKRLHWHQH
jgi:hypothetical protein